ncbi:MAG: hypothetical protein J3K34DRAFT_92112 [Monoraphidium minutum]|nr:MAG: hypothetical protein J3K34DRAFT_92112 [Monoraphidium minutum]
MLQRFKDEAADDAAPLKQARQRHKSAKDELQRLGAPPNSQTLAARRRKLMEDIEKHSNEHVTLQDRIGNLQQRSDQLRAETAEAQRVLTAAQRAFSELPPTVDHSAAIAALQDESAELLDKVINMDFNQRTLEDRQTALRGQRVKIMQAMAALDSTRTRRLQAMDRNKPGLAGLHHWLEDVKRRGGVLQGPAFGPLGLEVTLRDALSHAKVIDAACGDMLLAFAVTCRADEEVMSAEIKRRGMDGVTVHVMDQPLDTPYKQFSGPASNYRSFGVQSTLADLVDAPPLVMQALTSAGPALACSLFVPNESKIDELMRQPRVQTVFSLSAQFRVIKGSYGGSNARQAQDLGQPKYLGGGGAADPQAKEREQAALAEADAELADVERELGELGVARSQLDGQLKGVEGRREQLQAEQRQSLQQHNLLNRNMIAADKEYARKRATPDPLRSKPDMEAQQARAVEKHFEASIALMRLVRTQWEGVRERGVLELVLREAEMQVQALEGASSERKEREKALKDKVSKLQQLVARSKSKVEQARKQAQLEAPLTDEISARLEQLPDDMAVLAEKRSELEAKVAGIMCNNPRALEEFRERSAKISELRADVGGDEGALAALTSEIEDIKSTWLPELERVVARINTAFGAAFQEIGCAGEVHLNHAEGDYEKFAIEIMVKFRDNEELQLLTGTRQSGGERSVSTILYLLALQGVTVTPFRVVDEINQGMDPLNERKVFGQLVAASTREGTPQCFLLTPKLLPDLDYSASITVLMVMNGGLEDANAARG